MIQKYFLKYISDLKIEIKKPCLIFLRWDLWTGKTTLAKHIFNDILWIEGEVTSPTYTYYNKYLDNYHFDLYRINNYDEFFAIWWEEILDNNSWVILVEWPEIIEKYYSPDLEIILKKTENSEEREIKIKKR